MRAILEAAAAAKEAHIASTQAGMAEAKAAQGEDEENDDGGGGEIGPAIGPPTRPDTGPSIGPPARPTADTEPSASPSTGFRSAAPEDAPAVGPVIGPPARPAGIRGEKREIAEVEDAPGDALAAASAGGPSKKAKKAKTPVLSFGDDD